MTDKQLEKALRSVYASNIKELNKKIKAFQEHTEELTAQLRVQLDAGEITEEYFKQWQMVQIARSERFQILKDTIANKMADCNAVASEMVNNELPARYANKYNRSLFEAYGTMAYTRKKDVSNLNFTLTNEEAVKALMMGENRVNFKVYRPNRERNYKWNEKLISRALTNGIMQGEGSKVISKRFYDIMENNKAAAIRNARTAITSAENAGHHEGIKQASDLGIKIEHGWLCTHDDRTRESHAMMDGVYVPIDEPFDVDGSEMMYPCDPNGAPEQVYNCRCTEVSRVEGVDPHSCTWNNDKFYDEWLEMQRR